MDAGLPSNYFGRTGRDGQSFEMTEGNITPMIRERIAAMKATVMDFPNDEVNLADKDEVNLADKFDAFPSLLCFPHNRSIAPVSPTQVNREVIKSRGGHGTSDGRPSVFVCGG